jgi:hypothetical protein
MILTSLCCSEMLALKCSESGPLLLPPSFLASLFDVEPGRCQSTQCAPRQILTCTSLGGYGGCMCGVSSARRKAVLDVLDALCLVGVGEPVLAHVQVVAKANGAAGHKNLGNREGRHGWVLFESVVVVLSLDAAEHELVQLY